MPVFSSTRPAFIRAFAAALLVTGAATAGAAPDAALLAAANAAQPAVIASVKDMVLIESGSTDAAGLAKMAGYVEARLQALGARTERIEPARGPGAMVKGSFSGSGTQKLMLIAHMDTVYPAGTLASEPYHQDGNKLYGPGIADDKGGIAAILHSLTILKEAGWRDYAQLTVLFNHDEEVGSTTLGETIAQLAEQHDYVFSVEPTGAKAVAKTEGLLLGAAGTAIATMEVKGRSPHAGAAPDSGRNALIEIAYQLQQTRDIARSIPGAQLNWTMAQAGASATRSRKGDRPRRRSPDRAGRRRSTPHRLAGQGQGRPPCRRHRNDGDIAGRPAPLSRQRSGACARGTGAGDLCRTRRPRADAAPDERRCHRRRLRVAIRQGGRPRELRPRGLGYHARDEYIEIDSIAPRLYLMTRMLQTVARAP